MPEAARLHDAISHSQEGLFMKIGAVVGAVAGAVAVAGEVIGEVGAFFTGALTLPAIAGLGATVLTAGAQVAGATSFGMFIGKTLGSYFHHKAGEIISAAATVFIGGQPAARGEADVAKCDDHDGHEPSKSNPVQQGRLIAEGSETVFIETFHAARKGDKGTCLYRISGGCSSVIIGGAKVQLLDIAGSETPTLDKVMFVLGVVSGLGALRQAIAKGAVAATAFVLKTAGVVGASVGAGEVAKRWAGGKWGEGSEQQEQATLTAQLGAGVLAERGLSSKRGTTMLNSAATRIVAEGAATRDAMAAFAAKMRSSYGGSGTSTSTTVTPAMAQKILLGERVPNPASPGGMSNRIIGGHSPDLKTAPDVAHEVISNNSDGTTSVKFLRQFPDGRLSQIKSSTLAPDSWSNTDIMDAVTNTEKSPSVDTRARDGATLHRQTVNGVEWEVVKDASGTVTSAYPTGGRPSTPGGW